MQQFVLFLARDSYHNRRKKIKMQVRLLETRLAWSTLSSLSCSLYCFFDGSGTSASPILRPVSSTTPSCLSFFDATLAKGEAVPAE
jgi:hypothetical protein